MDESFARLRALLGEEDVARLASAHVVIAGAGAVGAMVAESLARSAVGRLTLIDFDVIQATNFNRHPFAFHSTLGKPKVAVVAQFLRDINPALQVDEVSCFLDQNTIPEVLAAHPCDVLVDAIDALSAKVELLVQAVGAGVPHLLSCLGAARRMEPTQFRVMDLFETRGCPLAQLVRKRLRRRGITAGIPCVCSTEPASEQAVGGETEPNFCPRGRDRLPLGSLHAATAAAGIVAARQVIAYILDLEKNST